MVANAEKNKKLNPGVILAGAICKSNPQKQKKKNHNSLVTSTNTNSTHTISSLKTESSTKMFQIPPAAASGTSGFIDFNAPPLLEMQNFSPANRKKTTAKKNRFRNRQRYKCKSVPQQPQQNIKIQPQQNNNNPDNNNIKNQRNRSQGNGIQSPLRKFPKMEPPSFLLSPMHGPPILPSSHLPRRRFVPIGSQIPHFRRSMPHTQEPIIRSGPISLMRPPIRPFAPMLNNNIMVSHGRPMLRPLALNRNFNNQIQRSNNRKLQSSNISSNIKTLKEILNQFPLNKPWVNDAIKAEAKIKESIENRLKGNKNDQLFAEFKIQRDKFVAMYEEAKKVFVSGNPKDNEKKEKIESDKVKATK